MRARLGWWAGCVSGYPTRPWHRWHIVAALAARWDPFNEIEEAYMRSNGFC